MAGAIMPAAMYARDQLKFQVHFSASRPNVGKLFHPKQRTPLAALVAEKNHVNSAVVVWAVALLGNEGEGQYCGWQSTHFCVLIQPTDAK